MQVVIFEGSQWRSFAPFSLSRPVFSLPCGAGTLLDKQLRATNPTRVTLWVRPELESYCRKHIIPKINCPADVNVPLGDEPALLMSGRSLHLSSLDYDSTQCVCLDDSDEGTLIRQAVVQSPGLSPADVLDRSDRWLAIHDLPRCEPQSRLPTYVWDLINWNEEAIVADYIANTAPSQPMPAGPFHIINEENVWLGSNVKLSPGCIIDGSRGFVILSDHVSIGANSIVEGPCFIGDRTQIRPLSYIRAGCSIGSTCKVGGEVSNSIFIGYANKSHEGFVGDSYIGKWANLGAGTTTSNLKNTYGEVSMRIDGETVKSGRRFLGSLIGDHVKTAIGTRLMTGTYIGYGSLLATSKFPPKFVRSFSFLTDNGSEPYRLDKLAEAQTAIFNRRNRVFGPDDEAMNQYVAHAAKIVES